MAAGIGLLAAAAPVAQAEEPASEPVPFVQATFPDINRSKNRFAETPYAALQGTQWYQFVEAQYKSSTESGTPPMPVIVQWPAILHQMDSASMAMNLPMVMGDPSIGVWMRGAGTNELLPFMLAEVRNLQPVNGSDNTWHNDEITLTKGDNLLTFSHGAETLSEPTLTGDGDLLLEIDYEGFAEMIGSMGIDQKTIDMMKKVKLTMSLKLDPIGIRESVTTTGADDLSEMWSMASSVVAKPELLESLPTDTLWAATTGLDTAAIDTFLDSKEVTEFLSTDADIAQMNLMLSDWGLPDWKTMIGALGEDHLIYARQSVPFPAITIALAIDAEIGSKVVTAIGTQAGWMDLGDSSYQGLLGMVPIYAGMDAGNLVLTTHPGGIATHANRQAGFFDNPAVQDALAEIPQDRQLQLIGLSRSADWYGSIADIAAPLAASSGIPGLAMMGRDLRGVAKHGFVWSSTDDKGNTQMESGGMLGGVMTQTVGVASAVSLLFTAWSVRGPMMIDMDDAQ